MGGPTQNHTQDIETLERLYAQRYSCRAYLDTPVPRPVIERILRVAQRTASWCNAQPWKLRITSGEETEQLRQALLEAVDTVPAQPDYEWPREYLGVHLDRRRECGLALYESVGIARGDKQAAQQQARENFRLFGAPHALIVTCEASLGDYSAIDSGAYAASFMLAARAMGVASIAQASLAARPDLLRRHFGMSDSDRVVCGISFGYADEQHPINQFRTTRAELADAVVWTGSSN
ncbi:nitroreductase [Hydrogenophaga sp. ANAO-22]|jgi:nitroreductase|uniref:nitroreductase n=1 Tax=Hydrogenophaga sp. ANAO-22 TaxID=3166645 RepID=UPI0036D2D019